MTLSSTPLHDPPPATAYEKRDVSIRAVLWLALGIVIAAVIVHVGLWVLLASLRREARQHDPRLSPLAETQPTPPAPRLQSAPSQDYRQFRREEDERLHSYGWVDREHKVVRIPIERAMELLAERGEPKIDLPQETPAQGTAKTGDSAR
jgi:hypothetical protein